MILYVMTNENIKLNKFKVEQKAKSRKTNLFDIHIKNSKSIEDKIALIKLKQKDNSLLLIESLKTLMKNSIKEK